jgi:hypothetical protein
MHRGTGLVSPSGKCFALLTGLGDLILFCKGDTQPRWAASAQRGMCTGGIDSGMLIFVSLHADNIPAFLF